MNPGRPSERIFDGRKDYLLFIELMKDVTELWDIKVSAFCLMPNHCPMLIHTPRGNMSRCMQSAELAPELDAIKQEFAASIGWRNRNW